MTCVLLVRHGHTEAVGNYLSGRKSGIHLTERGRHEAERLADELRDEGVDLVLASPLERAQETASAIAKRFGLPVGTEEALHEVDWGRWTGRTFSELREDPRWVAFQGARTLACPPNGEHLVCVQRRLVAWLDSLHGAPRRIVAVSHADPIRALVLHVLGAPPEFAHRLEIPTASISAIEVNSIPRVLYVGRRAPPG